MLIGLHGKARSGKTTVTNYLIEKYKCSEITFAGPLKDMVKHLFFMSDEQVNGEDKEKIDLRYGMSPRKILQYLGTNVYREIYPNIWIDHAIAATRLARDDLAMVISDVRFANEKTAIERESGLVWKIVREDHQGASSGISGHPSEHGMDLCDDSDFAAVLKARSGDIAGLLAQADKAMAKAMEEYS